MLLVLFGEWVVVESWWMIILSMMSYNIADMRMLVVVETYMCVSPGMCECMRECARGFIFPQ